MTLTIYTFMISQPARALKLFLLANKIPFEEKNVDIFKEEHLKEDYLKLNPLHKIPLLVHNGFVLRESVAILRYLCRELDIPDYWYPKESKKRARVDEYLEWQHLETRRNCWGYFLCKYFTPRRTGVPYDPNVLASWKKKMDVSLGAIENVWLEDKPYLIGDTISIADLLGVCEVEQPRMAGYDARKEYPRIGEWMTRVRKDLSPHYEEVHALLNKIAAEANS